MSDNFSLEDIRKICLSEGITISSMVNTIREAMEQAEYVTKSGDVLPDHQTRLKATALLCQLLQLPLLGKASALRELTGKTPASLRQLIDRRRVLESTAVEPPAASPGFVFVPFLIPFLMVCLGIALTLGDKYILDKRTPPVFSVDTPELVSQPAKPGVLRPIGLH